MNSDTVVRWGALTLVATAGLAAYFVATPSPDVGEEAVSPAASATAPSETASVGAALAEPPLAGVDSAAVPAPSVPGADEAPVPAPRAAAVAPPPPRRRLSPSPPSLAVDLPIVDVDTVEPVGAVPVATAASRAPEPPGPCGGVLVRLITASDDPSWAFATIADGPGKPPRVRRVGDPVAAWRVESIEWDRVWLRSGAARCPAGIHTGAREGQLVVGVDPSEEQGPLMAADDTAPPWHVPADVAGAIRQRSATEFVIDERAIATIFERGPDLLAGVEFNPVKDSEGVVGVALDVIPAHSLLDRLGIEKGDIVVALNDHPVLTLDAAIAALGDARTRAALVASLQRGGEPFAIDVAIEK